MKRLPIRFYDGKGKLISETQPEYDISSANALELAFHYWSPRSTSSIVPGASEHPAPLTALLPKSRSGSASPVRTNCPRRSRCIWSATPITTSPACRCWYPRFTTRGRGKVPAPTAATVRGEVTVPSPRSVWRDRGGVPGSTAPRSRASVVPRRLRCSPIVTPAGLPIEAIEPFERCGFDGGFL